MLLFLDTANIAEIREGVALGVIAGVTTNPTLLAREGRNPQEVVKEICALVPGPVSVEAVSSEAEEIIREAEELARLHPRVVVKVPVTREGLKAVKVLAARGIKTNVTLVFSVNQALLAALAGATYVSPFVGRLDDIGEDGMAVVAETVKIFKSYGLETKIIAASIRHPLHVTRAAEVGADIATVPFKVLEAMLKHPLTDLGVARFLADWEKLKEAVKKA